MDFKVIAFKRLEIASSSGSPLGALNDLWALNVPSMNWIFLSGTISINQIGVYGIQGKSSEKNVPGGRLGHTMALDSTGEHVFVFGGTGRDSLGFSGDLFIKNIVR